MNALDDNTWNFAPIIIPTICRFEHFTACVESLANNKYAEKTEVYIGIDHPLKTEHWDGYKKICEYVDNMHLGFKAVYVYKHDKNIGASTNIDFLYSKVLENHNIYIISEDDNVFSPVFLEFINNKLFEYQNNDDIVAVSGYFWPIKYDNIYEGVFIDTIYSAWGTAGWRDKDRILRGSMNMENFEAILTSKELMSSLIKKNRFIFSEFVKGMVEYSGCLIRNEGISPNDLAYSISMFVNKKKMIYPSKSLVRNIGNDGSGENCVDLRKNETKLNNRNFDYSNQNIANIIPWGAGLIDVDDERKLGKAFQDFFIVRKMELVKVRIILFLCRLLGRKNVKRIVDVFLH